MGISRASRALDSILAEGGVAAEAIKSQSGMHRTRLHTYRKGKGKPDADGIAVLHRLSDGAVAADGWEDDPPAAASNQPEGASSTGAS